MLLNYSVLEEARSPSYDEDADASNSVLVPFIPFSVSFFPPCIQPFSPSMLSSFLARIATPVIVYCISPRLEFGAVPISGFQCK